LDVLAGSAEDTKEGLEMEESIVFNGIDFEDAELEALIDYLEEWGEERGMKFMLVGTVGFGRPCVGYVSKYQADQFVSYNPVHLKTYEHIESVYDERLVPPEGVKDAYHKGTYLCVLRHEEEDEKDGTAELAGFKEAVRQLKEWTDHLDSFGEAKIVAYDTGSEGMQEIFIPRTGFALALV
jgi:hypothetical protein